MSFLNALKFLPKEEVLGVELDGDILLSAHITTTSKNTRINRLEHVKPIDKGVDSSLVASVFPSSKTLVRPLDLAVLKQNDIDATLPFEIEPNLPYPLDSCILDKIILEKSNGISHLQVFSALKTDLQAHIDELQAQNIDPEIICPKSCCLAHFCKLFFPETAFQIVVDIGTTETTLVLVNKGKPLIARSHPVGLEMLQRSSEESEETLSELHGYLRELARIVLSFEQHQEVEQNLPLLFTGQIVEEPLLCKLITTFLQREEVALVTLPETVQINSEIDVSQISAFACPIGAALSHSYLKKGMESANFRQGELASKNLWKRYRPEFIAYYTLMCACALALFFLGQIELTKQKHDLIQKYSELLVTLDKAPQEDLGNASPRDIEDELFTIESSLQLSGDEMALHPDIARVSDLLAWLSNHPNVSVTINEATDNHSLELETLSYVMVKRPEKGKTKEPYQVRVDLEFSSPSATLAREFHDALLAPNQFVDPKNELKWTVQRGRYRASFFLKDRTQYPHTIQVPHASN